MHFVARVLGGGAVVHESFRADGDAVYGDGHFGHTRIRCELVDHGQYGVEVRILYNEEHHMSPPRRKTSSDPRVEIIEHHCEETSQTPLRSRHTLADNYPPFPRALRLENSILHRQYSRFCMSTYMSLCLRLLKLHVTVEMPFRIAQRVSTNGRGLEPTQRSRLGDSGCGPRNARACWCRLQAFVGESSRDIDLPASNGEPFPHGVHRSSWPLATAALALSHRWRSF